MAITVIVVICQSGCFYAVYDIQAPSQDIKLTTNKAQALDAIHRTHPQLDLTVWNYLVFWFLPIINSQYNDVFQNWAQQPVNEAVIWAGRPAEKDIVVVPVAVVTLFLVLPAPTWTVRLYQTR